MDVSYTATSELTPTERVLVGVCESINEKPLPKRLQRVFHNSFGKHFIRLVSSNLLEVNGIEHAEAMDPERGVLLCSNHRSFFDMYMVTSILRNERLPWFRDVYFPVRSKFFYDQWRGLAINLAISGGAMYPPIFRDRNKSGLNKVAVNRIVNLLERPGAVVGVHPEGTRSKGDSPYDLLPAKPGVGQMALRSKATVLPIWVSGMSNDFAKQVASNFRADTVGRTPVRVTFGAPVDLGDLASADVNSRKVHQQAADHIMADIAKIGDEERLRLQGSLS
ncbi:MAG: 1-acyl-sn-glycerol-3-phosphate acyltransferase [Myxococcales bacterium]|nr:1-acyl-sn-glycerol-3-phosphate acyltransferase [Myxococcales bacterium]